MKVKLKKILLAFCFFLLLFFSGRSVLAQSDQEKLDELNKKIEEYTQKISQLQGEQKTLSSTIAYLESKVQLTSAEIAKTEQELKILAEDISKLDVKIDILDESLEEVSTILGSRIKETYKRSLVNPFYLIFSSDDFADALSRIKY